MHACTHDETLKVLVEVGTDTDRLAMNNHMLPIAPMWDTARNEGLVITQDQAQRMYSDRTVTGQ